MLKLRKALRKLGGTSAKEEAASRAPVDHANVQLAVGPESQPSVELAAARKKIAELETQLGLTVGSEQGRTGREVLSDAAAGFLDLTQLDDDESGSSEQWNLVGWVRGTGLHRVIAAAILRGAEEKGFGTDSDAALTFLRSLQDKSELAVLFGYGPVADTITETLWPEVLQVQAASAATTIKEIMGKFDGAIELSFYGLDKFFGGLGGIIGEPSNQVHTGMELEHLQGSESTEEFVTG